MSHKQPIRVGYALPGPGISSAVQAYEYLGILGRTATLLPAGENIQLDAHLPRRGTLLRQIALSDWGSDWLVMGFDEPFQFDGATATYALIRARWVGCPVGSEFCPVFVLLNRHLNLSIKEQWSSKDFQFVSWNQVEVNG